MGKGSGSLWGGSSLSRRWRIKGGHLNELAREDGRSRIELVKCLGGGNVIDGFATGEGQLIPFLEERSWMLEFEKIKIAKLVKEEVDFGMCLIN